MRAVLSIGSNIGDSLGHLRDCVAGLGDAVRAVSPVYRTAPWGGVEQDDFLNAIVVVADDTVDADGWLDRAHGLEQQAERVRDVRWGPRTLDVDVVTVDGVRRDTERLTLPHPRAQLRAFVLVPWYDVEPTAELPGRGPIVELIAALPAADREGVHRCDDLTLRAR